MHYVHFGRPNGGHSAQSANSACIFCTLKKLLTVISQNINCNQAKRINIVPYLEILQVKPTRVAGNDYWYLSPLRQEKDPSFEVNRKLNVWYDHGIGKGGNLIDFGIQLFNCTVYEFLKKLRSQGDPDTFSFHLQTFKNNRLLKKEISGISIKAIWEIETYPDIQTP